MKYIASILAAAAFGPAAFAGAVDLSGWTAEEVSGNTAANWTVQGASNDSVFQSQNSRPSIFFDPTASLSQGTALSGTITVETANDDDFIGFVLGYQSGENNSASTDFILIDWKQGNQNGCGGTAQAGLSISRVTDTTNGECSFWLHNNGVTELARASSLGNTGWNDNQTYDFDLIFQPDFIQVKVNGNIELTLTAAQAGLGSFDNGAFGFYNYSQDRVRYGAIEEDVAPPTPEGSVPAPAALGFLGLGLAGLGFARRRRS